MSARSGPRNPRTGPQGELDETGYGGLFGLGHVAQLSDVPVRRRRRPLGFAPPKPPARKGKRT